jgi:hypothetical protein
MTDTPQLFPWGRGGIPDRFREQLINAERETREADNLPPIAKDQSFFRKGIERLARERRALLRSKRQEHAAKRPAPSQSKRQEFRPHAEDMEWTWLLLKHCSDAGEPPPPELQWLIFETLGLEEGKPALERAFGGPGISAGFEPWAMASRLDYEADARGEDLTASKLAKAVGVDRETITRWRKTEEYRRRRGQGRVAVTEKPKDN